MASRPRLYDDLAHWWPLLSAPADYAQEADYFRRTLAGACDAPPRTLLELGSGGGNTASHLKAHLPVTLTDISPGMLAVSRALNPECEHVEGDMRTVRLGRLFDCVLVHDAIMYMTSEADLGRAIQTCFQHTRPGGATLLAPDAVTETFRPGTDQGGHDGSDGRALRYLEWIWDPDPSDTTYFVDYAYLLRDRTGDVHVEHDRHTLGLFHARTWLRFLTETGFQPRVLKDKWDRHIFLATRP